MCNYLSLDERGVDDIAYSHNNRLLLSQPSQRGGIILNKYATGIRQQIMEIEVNSFDSFLWNILSISIRFRYCPDAKRANGNNWENHLFNKLFIH